MKLLTITIPVYNTEKYIKRCLDSLLVKEIIDELEIILVNDGSTDNSIEILNDYQRKYPKSIIVIDKPNGGHGSTVNAGLKKATGKYFKVIDSDDWVDTFNFINFVKDLAKYNEDVIASPYTEEYTYSGISIKYNYDKIKNNTSIKFDNIKNTDVAEFYFPMASATYKLDILKKCNLSLYENSFYVDMQYNIMPIPYIKTVRYLDKPIYRYFIGRPTQSMSQESLTRNYLHHKKVLTFLVDYYTKFSNSVSKVQKEYMNFMATSMIYTFFTIVCIQIKDKKLAYKTFKEFDTYLKNTNTELYNSSNLYGYIRYSRKLKFLNVRYFMNLFIKIINFVRKVRS